MQTRESLQAMQNEERRLQGRALLAVFCGDDGAAALRDELASLRARILEDLRAAGEEEASRWIEDEVAHEAQRLRHLEDGEACLLLEGAARGTSQLYLASLASGERFLWLRSVHDAVAEETSCRYELLVHSETRWIGAQALELERVDRGLATVTNEIRDGLRALRHRRQCSAIDQWLATGKARESPEDVFRSNWMRVLQYHRMASDFEVTAPPDRTRVDRLRDRHGQDLRRCREALDGLVGESREKAILDAVDEAESDVSALLSEGDLLDVDEQRVKYRSAAAAVDDVERVVGATRREQRSWFRSGSRRLGNLAKELRHLRWIRRHAEHSAQRALVESRMYSRLGRGMTRGFENLVFVLILLLVAVVMAEWHMETSGTLTPAWALGLQLVDLVICSVLLGDFFYRWSCAGWATWFIRRFFVFDLLPALPFDFLLGPLWLMDYYFVYGTAFYFEHGAAFAFARYAHLLLLLRIVRIARVFRGIRLAVTFLRLFRLFVFVVRGLDRVVQRFRGFLDRNVLLFETFSSETDGGDALVVALAGHEARRLRLTRELFRETKFEERPRLLSGHLLVVEHFMQQFCGAPAGGLESFRSDRDLHLESVIVKLMTCNQMAIESTFSRREVERLAQLLRWTDLPLVRWLPLLRWWVKASRLPDPAEALAEAARELGRFLQGILGVFHLGGDLSGITTAPQVLDRVATAMIKSTQRPAVRLILFGGLALVASVVSEFFGFDFGQRLLQGLGLPFVVLGAVCLVVNITGRWFKKISGEALDTYMRTSEAHFFHLVKEVKAGRLRRDMRKVMERVVLPECRIRKLSEGEIETACEFLESRLTALGRQVAEQSDGWKDAARRDRVDDFLFREVEQIALLYRDYLDGPLLHRSDDKTSIQLLGNLAMRDIRLGMLGMGKKELRRLERLSLQKDRILGFGPYLWFRFISESLAIETARLVMEYNASCLPLDRLPHAHHEQRSRYDRFLDEKRRRVDHSERRRRRAPRELDTVLMVTTEFDALHFLTDDAARDHRILRIFGEEVQRAVIADRRAMVRDVFGTWPYHLLPRSVRRVNPYRLYFRFLGGARIFLLPLVLLGRLAGIVVLLGRGLAGVVREVLGKHDARSAPAPRMAGFEVAVRKINRMRKPYFMEATRLRAAVDAEYLGLRIPGMKSAATQVTYREDLDFIGALQSERIPFEEIRRSALRDLRRLRVFLAERDWHVDDFGTGLGMIDPAGSFRGREHEVFRAVVSAFITDQHELRTTITGPREIHAFFENVLERRSPGLVSRLFKRLLHDGPGRFLAGARARRELFETYAALAERLRHAPPALRRRALHAFLEAPRTMARCCDVAIRLEKSREDYDRSALEVLRRVAAEHSLWSRKLITLRMVQSLTVLDVEAYRDLIRSLGGFDRETEDPSVGGNSVVEGVGE